MLQTLSFQPAARPAVVSKTAKGDAEYLRMAPNGAAVWVADPAKATAFGMPLEVATPTTTPAPLRAATMPLLTIIAAAAIAASATAHPAGGLSLERGAYVSAGVPCADAANSAHSWYSGSGYVIQAPHARCRALRVRLRGHGVFEVVQTCRDESMPNSDYRVHERIQVIGPTEYVVKNDFGRFHARWCRE